MGPPAGVALHPREQGVSHGVAEAPPDARPAGTRPVPDPPPDRGRSRRHGLGHGGMGGPLCGPSALPFLVERRRDGRPGGAGRRAAGPARGRGRGGAFRAAARRRRADAEDRAARPLGPGPLPRRHRLPRGRRPAADPRGGPHRGCLARRPGPSAGAGAGDGGDGELLLALESEAEGLTQREVAVRLWGAQRVADEWWSDGWMLGRLKRRRRRARAILKQYREMATRT